MLKGSARNEAAKLTRIFTLGELALPISLDVPLLSHNGHTNNISGIIVTSLVTPFDCEAAIVTHG